MIILGAPAADPTPMTFDPSTLKDLARVVKQKAFDLGFQKLGVSDTNLDSDRAHLDRWLALKRHGDMDYMARHGSMRTTPQELLPGTVRVITARMDYLPQSGSEAERTLTQPDRAYIARYALGRDYHKLMRRRLKRLAEWLRSQVGDSSYRVLVDSAPVMERALARNAGLGWIGKHTNLLDRQAGSWFLLGEIYTDLPLPCDHAVTEHCGSCRACIDVCPTRAIVGPYELDARRCISYLTIEHQGTIADEFREAIGNRIFGCDDCLAVCPWNKFAQRSHEARLAARAETDNPPLADMLNLDDAAFRKRFAGTPVKRTGRDRFMRNVLIAAGNSADVALLAQVEPLLRDASALVRAMAVWACARLMDEERFKALRAELESDESDEQVRAEWRRMDQ